MPINLPSPPKYQKRFLETKAKSVFMTFSIFFGVTLALAWNDAIKQTMKMLFGNSDGLVSLYIYAIVMTIVAFCVLRFLLRKMWIAHTDDR